MLKVLKSGFYVSVQDLGRKGFAKFGVPNSGAMDLYSFKLGNHLLGNHLNCASIEIAYGNAKFQFTKPTLICVTGADFNAVLNGNSIVLNKVLSIQKGDIVSFTTKNYGIRTYVAVLDGFLSEEKLNSKSFYKGITSDVVLRKGDEVRYVSSEEKRTNFSSIKVRKNHFVTHEIQSFKAPEFELLSAIQKEQLKTTEFTISNDNSRMGYKLNEVIKNDFGTMLTSAVLPGTVQLTPSGKLIVLMRDCQVTGGYPRILQVSEQSINQLAQKSTKDSFKFVIT